MLGFVLIFVVCLFFTEALRGVFRIVPLRWWLLFALILYVIHSSDCGGAQSVGPRAAAIQPRVERPAVA